jgi:hypothetical protein
MSMLKRGADVGPKCLDDMKLFAIETLKAPGLLAIKQIGLYKKWCQYMNPQYWDDMCSKPSDDFMKQVKSDKAEKRMQTMTKTNKILAEKKQEQARKKVDKEADREAKIVETTL